MKFWKKPLFWIFMLALCLRVYKLEVLPYGFHVDEIKVGWNAISVLQTGLTDQLKSLGLYYNSIGDYRPTGLFYLSIPFVAIFGRTEFAVRLPVALFGALSIFPVYLLANIIISKKIIKQKTLDIGNIAALLIAISPWSINLSRATNEVVVSTFFGLFAIYFYIKVINTAKNIYGYLAITSITLSYFFYHSIRYLGLPIFIILTVYHCRKNNFKKSKRWILASLIFLTAMTIYLSTTKEGLARFSQVSIFTDTDTNYQIERIEKENNKKTIFTMVFDNNLVIYAKKFIGQYSQYFSGDFLVGEVAKPYRFTTPGTGLITYFDLIFVLFGLFYLVRNKKNLLPIILLLLVPLPAAITSEDTPNLSRSFLMLPFLLLIESYGLLCLLQTKKITRITTFLLILGCINSFYYFHMYVNHSLSHRPYIKNFPGDSPSFRNVGIKELVLKLDSLSNSYEKILVTNFPDSPYAWYAFFTHKDPLEINNTYSSSTNERVYKNIIFSEEKCPADTALLKYNKRQILIIESWECPVESQIKDGYPLKIIDTIKRPDGSTAYTLLERDFTKPLIIKGVYY